MAQPAKIQAVAEIKERFENSHSAVVTEYRGMSVQQVTELRKALGGEASYTVAKNTLTKRAAAEAGIEGLDEYLSGPTAITFVTGEIVNAAKALKEFAKDNEQLVIKGGIMDGSPLSPAELDKVADLESREVLLGKLAGALKANQQKAAGLFNAPASQLARVFGALQDQKGE